MLLSMFWVEPEKSETWPTYTDQQYLLDIRSAIKSDSCFKDLSVRESGTLFPLKVVNNGQQSSPIVFKYWKHDKIEDMIRLIFRNTFFFLANFTIPTCILTFMYNNLHTQTLIFYQTSSCLFHSFIKLSHLIRMYQNDVIFNFLPYTVGPDMGLNLRSMDVAAFKGIGHFQL